MHDGMDTCLLSRSFGCRLAVRGSYSAGSAAHPFSASNIRCLGKHSTACLNDCPMSGTVQSVFSTPNFDHIRGLRYYALLPTLVRHKTDTSASNKAVTT